MTRDGTVGAAVSAEAVLPDLDSFVVVNPGCGRGMIGAVRR
jgi:hypothetical protein